MDTTPAVDVVEEVVTTAVEAEEEEIVVLPSVLPPLPLPKIIELSEIDKNLLNSLTITEKLLICQSVFEFGSNNFKSISKVLQGHKLLNNRSKLYFSSDKCSKVFTALMNELGESSKIPYPPNAAPLLKLARKYYMLRVVELRTAMQLESDKFRIQFSEIQQMKEGGLDHLLDSSLISNSNNNSSSSPLKSVASTSGLSTPLKPLPSLTSTPTPSKRGSGRGRGRGKRGRGRSSRGGSTVISMTERIEAEAGEEIEVAGEEIEVVEVGEDSKEEDVGVEGMKEQVEMEAEEEVVAVVEEVNEVVEEEVGAEDVEMGEVEMES